MPPRRGQKPVPDPDQPRRPCDAPGCTAAGEFRAPRSRSALNEYVWFCLPHVREYNSAWDYYKGMGPAEIEANLRQRHRLAAADLAARPARRRTAGSSAEYLADPLGILRDTPLHAQRTRPREEKREAPPELRAALDVLGLVWPVETPALRARYKELAKQLPPRPERRRPRRGRSVEGREPRLQPAAPAARRQPGHGAGGAGRSQPLSLPWTLPVRDGSEFALPRVACRRTLA